MRKLFATTSNVEHLVDAMTRIMVREDGVPGNGAALRRAGPRQDQNVPLVGGTQRRDFRQDEEADDGSMAVFRRSLPS